jgi:hypothetical protein
MFPKLSGVHPPALCDGTEAFYGMSGMSDSTAGVIHRHGRFVHAHPMLIRIGISDACADRDRLKRRSATIITARSRQAGEPVPLCPCGLASLLPRSS